MRPQRIVASLLGGLALFIVMRPCPALSQLVQVRPGYIRAPFVRIYTDPYGGSHVRAPFVSVTSPGYYPRPYVGPRRRAVYRSPNAYAPNTYRPNAYAPATAGSARPTPATRRTTTRPRQEIDLATLDWRALRQRVSAGASQLGQQMRSMPGQTQWRDYLKTSELVTLMTDAVDEMPRGAERERLQKILANYNVTGQTDPLPRVATLASFQQVHTALDELLTDPVERQRRSLRKVADTLNEQLARLRASSGWADYLRIPLRNPNSRLTESIVDGTNRWPANPETERELLQQTLTRFENVLNHPEYQAVARLSGFQPAYQRLARYLELTDPAAVDIAADDDSSSALEGIETLPEPQSPEPQSPEPQSPEPQSAGRTPAESTPAAPPRPGQPILADPRGR